MAKLSLAYDDNNAGRALERSMRDNAQRVSRTLMAVARVSRDEVLERGREDIANAGHFGRRWTQGLKGDIEDEGNGGILLNFHHDVPYFMVHQRGATIHGNPELAIPLSFSDAVGTRARDYPGGLFRVDRKQGAPLLLAFRDKKPKYVLIKSVRIPKRFHVIEIIRDVASTMRAKYREIFIKSKSK